MVVISVLIFKAFGLLYYWFKCLMSSYIRKWGVWGHTLTDRPPKSDLWWE